MTPLMHMLYTIGSSSRDSVAYAMDFHPAHLGFTQHTQVSPSTPRFHPAYLGFTQHTSVSPSIPGFHPAHLGFSQHTSVSPSTPRFQFHRQTPSHWSHQEGQPLKIIHIHFYICSCKCLILQTICLDTIGQVARASGSR